MDDLYRDYILDHYKRPRNFGELEPHDLEAHEHNPLCGDELGVHIRVRDRRIEDLRFHGHGCAISQASASIASEELKGMERVRAHEQALTEHMLERLPQVPGLRVVGPPEADRRGGLASFTLDGIHPHDVAELADRGGVCIRAGHHCAQPLMRRLGIGSSARASFAVHNSFDDVDRLMAGLESVRKVLQL